MHVLYSAELGRSQANLDDCVKHCTSIIKISILIGPGTDKCYYKQKSDTKTTKIHIFLHSSPSLTFFFNISFLYV